MQTEQRIDHGYTVVLPGNPNEYVPGVNLYRRLEHSPDAKPVLIVPPLGNTEIAIKYLAKSLGLPTLAQFVEDSGVKDETATTEVGLPIDPITDQIKERGILESPAMMCDPYKYTQGFLMHSLDKFEQARSRTSGNFYPLIITHQSSGFCRERCYGSSEESVLRYSSRNPHKDFDFYVVSESLRGTWDIVSLLSGLSGKGRWRIIRMLNKTIERLDIVEKFEDKIRYAQSLGGNYDDIDRVLTEAKQQAAAVDLDNSQLGKVFAGHLKRVDSFERDREKPEGIIAITGEIFHCEELMRNSSYGLGRELLKRGFYFKREVGLHHYTPRFRLTPDRLARWLLGQINPSKRDLIAEEAAAGGSLHDPGGHGKDIVALAKRQSRTKEYDGILEIYPFLCMPSVVVASIVKRILESSGTPYMSLQMDEQFGIAGIITRLEAWLDLIIRKKRQTMASFAP